MCFPVPNSQTWSNFDGEEETAALECLTKVKIVLLKLEDESFSVDQLKEFESIQSEAGLVEIDIWTGKGRLLKLPPTVVGKSPEMARRDFASSTIDEVERLYDLNDEDSDL
jgi:hypothetical protein